MKLTLKSIGMAAALVAGLATLSIAGTGGKPMGTDQVKERVAKMKADLALTDDQATRIEQILNDGAVHQAITYRPLKALAHVKEQPSWTQPLAIAEAAVYPGFLNRRIRWEASAEKEQPLKPAHLKTAYDLAAPEFEKILAGFRQQLKHHLAPRDAVGLMRCKTIGRIGERVILEDAKGARIEAADHERQENYSNVANLVPKFNANQTGMMEADFTQFLSTNFGLTAGKLDIIDSFQQEFSGNYRTQFMNTALTIPMALALFPLSAYGGGVIVLPTKDIVLSALAIDPNGTPTNNDISEAFDDGAMVVASALFWRVAIRRYSSASS